MTIHNYMKQDADDIIAEKDERINELETRINYILEDEEDNEIKIQELAIVEALVKRLKIRRRRMKKLSRFWNFLYAFCCRYFWLPCPICGKNFRGHEWRDGAGLMIFINQIQGICPSCKEEAKRRNKEWAKMPEQEFMKIRFGKE